MRHIVNGNIKLAEIKYGTVPKILFIGNGLNRLFDQEAWDKIIGRIAVSNNVQYEQDKMNKLPLMMQIVAVTNDNVDRYMKELMQQLLEVNVTDQQKSFLSKILEMPFAHIISTNYTYELEHTICGSYGKNMNWRNNFCTLETNNSINELNHRFTKLNYNSDEKYIWHIHGQAYKPSGVVMGHYYYGKSLSYIQDYIPGMMRRWRGCKNYKSPYYPMSWIDYFIFGEVYMIGFGMDFSEIDLWWLSCCKKRNGEGTRIHFFTPESDISKEKEMMMEAYNIDIIKGKLRGKNYKEYYEGVIRQLEEVFDD